MTCGNVMTRNPSCCLPGDSASTAARIMKQQDVGPVPVVTDHTGMQLTGIVTDRDIALSVVAEGRDPLSTRVDSIMSSDPVTVSEEDDVMRAVKRMADYQVRRIPVVDRNNRLIGIISQADIARTAQEAQVGEMVEEISQPWGLGEWPEGKYETSRNEHPEHRSSGMDTTSALAIGALCLGFGAGLMFMFDPSRGQKRRKQLQTRTNDLWSHRNEVVEKTKSAISDRAHTVVGAAKTKLGAKITQQEQPWQGEPQFAGQSTPGSWER